MWEWWQTNAITLPWMVIVNIPHKNCVLGDCLVFGLRHHGHNMRTENSMGMGVPINSTHWWHLAFFKLLINQFCIIWGWIIPVFTSDVLWKLGLDQTLLGPIGNSAAYCIPPSWLILYLTFWLSHQGLIVVGYISFSGEIYLQSCPCPLP